LSHQVFYIYDYSLHYITHRAKLFPTDGPPFPQFFTFQRKIITQ